MTATVKHDEKGPTEKWLPQISTTRTLVKMQIMKMQKYEVISFINSANTFKKFYVKYWLETQRSLK